MASRPMGIFSAVPGALSTALIIRSPSTAEYSSILTRVPPASGMLDPVSKYLPPSFLAPRRRSGRGIVRDPWPALTN